ncbi:PKD domain-containing protein [Rhodoglobus aureus]|uniref:PKD domain-containing protein n=1 Tax=Rhodoglobus aureus TaxID=191497 RepID=A0ABN1VG63_9MICO
MLKVAKLTTALAIGMLIGTVPVTQAAASATNDRCSEMDYSQGLCAKAGVADGAVELGATTEVPASGGSGSSNNSADGVSFEAGAPVEVVDTVGESWCDLQRLPCVPWTPPADAATGPVTISDIATFRPQPPTAGMQPNQWMIVGLATNFYANASAHVVDGTLFGGTAQVRFTPIAYNWNYGDGTTATLGTAGTTWAKQKIAEFDPTPTSHAYDTPGNYTITLSVTYAAEYRVAGSSWQNVVGTLTIVAPPLTATAGHATTVLVDKDCIANPTGIGC